MEAGNLSRTNAIFAIAKRGEDRTFSGKFANPVEQYGCNVFDDKAMRKHLPKPVYQSLRHSVQQGKQLDPQLADVVAAAMKDWAIARGATHYTHVFYPLTGLTAEKHDSFLVPDGQGGALAEFSGNMLAKGEADGSSLPSGGLRSTFEARGYTAWDVTSPAYLMESGAGMVLCIPTVFLSWTGLALDTKTPLLRSIQVVSRQAARVLKLFEAETGLPIEPFAGLEQEYFLIDSNFAFARPDLLVAGRTLLGAKPSKGQEFEDQYYGVIPNRVLDFMMDMEHELYRLGVPIKTRHNEVAPSQYEIAPIYESANLATDHNQLIMTVLRKTAKKHGMICLLSEKPFYGISGSGKHINYSLGNKELGNLFDPGDTPHENGQFLVFLCAMIRALHKYAGFLKATVSSASNDLRLGSHEAPPAIISLFLGDQLADVLEQFRIGKVKGSKKKRIMNVGVDSLPQLSADPGDRNRTSPFAFVGNRFEFRALGSSMSAASAILAINVMLTESLDYVATYLERIMGGDRSRLWEGVQALIEHIMEEHSGVIFNGDNYSGIWHQEARRRGLPDYPNTPAALTEYANPAVIDLCSRYNVFTRQELRARQDIYYEQYIKTVRTEAKLVLRMVRTMLYPAAIRYCGELAASANSLSQAGIKADSSYLAQVHKNITQLERALAALDQQMSPEVWEKLDFKQGAANHCLTKILPAMGEVRVWADALEEQVADDLWPLPTYQEMLFMK